MRRNVPFNMSLFIDSMGEPPELQKISPNQSWQERVLKLEK